MRYKPMLAQPAGDYSRITKEEWESGLYIQPKLDGVRCLIQCDNRRLLPYYQAITAYSRTGKEWKNIDHILKELVPFFEKYPDVILDGELYNHDLRDNFEKIISLVRKTKPTDEDRLESAEKVQFHCYDMIDDDNMSYSDRYEFLGHTLTFIDSVHTLDTFGVYNTEEVEVCHEDFLEQGYEGSILRKNEPYECKRSWTLMKIKDFSDAEAEIIGWVEGKGKRKGTLGKFVMRDDDGNEFGCPPGKGYNYKDMSNLLHRAPHYIGARATFTYFERTKAGSYRHPLFKSIRNYE
jgi:DNA ligase-1